MGSGFVRLGGVMAFASLAVIVFGIAAILALGSSIRTLSEIGPIVIVTLVVALIASILTAIALWATKVLFNALSYRGGDVPILITLVCMAIYLAIAGIGGAGGSMVPAPGSTEQSSQVLVIVNLIVGFIMLVAFIWWAISCIVFGGRARMGLWKAVGILFLIVSACLVVLVLLSVVTNLTGAPGQQPSRSVRGLIGVVVLAGFAVWIGAVICHGIGLIMGAARMDRPGRPQ